MKPCECVMCCTAEQVDGGGSDRFRADRKSVRHETYSHSAGAASIYSSGSQIDLCNNYKFKSGWDLRCDWPHRKTHRAWQCMKLPHTNRCSGSLLMLVNNTVLFGTHFRLNGCPSTHKKKTVFFFASICISFSSRGAPLRLWVAPFLVQFYEQGVH